MSTQTNTEHNSQHQYDVTGQPQIIEPSLERLMGKETALPTQEQEVPYGTLAAASPEQILRKKAPKISQHTVQAGEGLWSIAKKYNPLASVTEIAQLVQKIVKLNNLGSAKALIAPGQTLKVPSTINAINKKQTSKKVSVNVIPKINDKLRVLEQKMMGQQPDRTRVFQRPVFEGKQAKKENTNPTTVKAQATKKQQNKKTKNGSVILANLMKKSKLTSKEIAIARKLIEQEKDVKKKGDLYLKLQKKVVYNSQRDSKAKYKGRRVEGSNGGMCNLATMAMCLSYLGVGPENKNYKYFEDELEEKMTEAGLAGLREDLNSRGKMAEKIYNVESTVIWSIRYTKKWFEENLKDKYLSKGWSALVGIEWKHIVRLESVTNEGLIIDDPYSSTYHFVKVNGKYERQPFKANTDKKPNHGENNLWTWEFLKNYKSINFIQLFHK